MESVLGGELVPKLVELHVHSPQQVGEPLAVVFAAGSGGRYGDRPSGCGLDRSWYPLDNRDYRLSRRSVVEQMSAESPGSRTRARRSTLARRLRWLLPALVAVVWLAAAGPLNAVGSKLTGLQENDNAAFLPDSAESTRVSELQRQFQQEESLPLLIVWEQPDGISPQTRQAVTGRVDEIRTVLEDGNRLTGRLSPPIPSQDGQALQVIAPLRTDLGDELVQAVEEVRGVVQVPGATAYVTGPGGVFADFANGFAGIDGLLLLAAFGVVLLILLVIYRSPLLPLLVIGTAVLALSAANAVAYLLVKNGLITVNGQSQGIAAILIVGAATDYGLLIVARYREELRRHQSKYEAMRIALRRSVAPIMASGATVILGVLCLLFSDLASNRGLGPISAVNVALAVLAALTFLPAALTLLGRAAFWPFRPDHGSQAPEQAGLWGRVAGLVQRRPGPVLGGAVAFLLAGAAFLPMLKADGISLADAIRGSSQAVDGQAVLARHFDAGVGSPAVIITPAASAQAVVRAADAVDGVARVAPVTQAGPGGGQAEPRVVNGLVELEATLADPADSDAAVDTVSQLRQSVRAVEAQALVGGATAIDLDTRETSERDRAVIIPLVLLVVTVVLALLLRSLVAPLLLTATVVLSFAATLGIAALMFNQVFNFPGSDPGVVLIGFVFLIALGVDYNIFLMTRAREETLAVGTREGILRALAVTGGVITSAGLVLAATFGALVVLPLLILTQVAFIVAFGVLLDTFLVRSLVVPAAVYLLGDRAWWPSRLAGGRPSARPPAGQTDPAVRPAAPSARVPSDRHDHR
jgi:RND superfamily putative drug exporter